MKAIIIAAGSGQRLGSEIAKLPKALLDINGKTILERQINLLKNKPATVWTRTPCIHKIKMKLIRK